MAKLQGHFLRYRDQPEIQVEKAKKILEEDAKIEEMTVSEWLRRLALERYAPAFAKHRIYYASDLRHFEEEEEVKERLGLEDVLHRKRFLCMIQGNDQLTNEDFKLISAASAR